MSNKYREIFFFILIAIPFNFLIKNYELRKLKFFQFRKNLIKINISHKDLVYLNLFYQNSFFYEKEFLRYKSEKIYKINMKNSDDNDFDNTIKKIIINSDEYEDHIITGETSYNLAVILFIFKNLFNL